MMLEEAAKLVGVVLPTTRNAIKTAYHRRARVEHPDVSKHPEARERFMRLQTAFEVLEKGTADEEATVTTDDGTLLSSLGQGLGPLVNGRPCDDCQGRGFRSYDAGKNAPCEECGATGTRRLPRTGVRVSCRFCKGIGVVKATSRLRYVKCNGCKGCGETKIYNPVLPKGLLV